MKVSTGFNCRWIVLNGGLLRTQRYMFENFVTNCQRKEGKVHGVNGAQTRGTSWLIRASRFLLLQWG
jgi:hypothetical protein